MIKLSIIDKISFILCILGCINWGVIGLSNVNLLSMLSFGETFILRGIYILIMLASLDLIYVIFKCAFVFKN